ERPGARAVPRGLEGHHPVVTRPDALEFEPAAAVGDGALHDRGFEHPLSPQPALPDQVLPLALLAGQLSLDLIVPARRLPEVVRRIEGLIPLLAQPFDVPVLAIDAFLAFGADPAVPGVEFAALA